MILTHELPQAAFDQIADGYGDADSIAALLAGQVSRRQIALRAVLDHVDSSVADEHFALLVAAQAKDAEAVESIFTEPHVGAWIFAVLRRLRGVWPGAVTPSDLSYLGAAAASAAFSAGVDFTCTVATEHGRVFLPGMGTAEKQAATTTLSSANGCLAVGDVTVEAGAPGWHPSSRLRSAVDGQELTVTLEDADPFRDCHRLDASGRLSDEEVARWQELLDGAWRILVRQYPRHAAGIGAGLRSLVPLRAPHSSHGVNATSMDAFGAMSLTPPSDETALAASILHEFQHAKLGALLDLVPLYTETRESPDRHDRLYAPWRDDPRPLSGLMQGVYAFLGVTDFWRTQRLHVEGAPVRSAEFEFARWRERVWRSHDVLLGSGRFTPHGERFLARMRATQRPWQDEPVAPDVADLAREAAQDHWIGWRLRNLRPAAEVITELTESWCAGSVPPSLKAPVTTLPSDGRALVFNPRHDLTTLSITDPARFARLSGDPEALAREVPDASPGDVALIRGDDATALTQYCQELRLRPARHEPWVGLALTLRRTRREGMTALSICPEVAFAVFVDCADRGVELPDPVVLAEWLRDVVPDGGPDAEADLSMARGQVVGGSMMQDSLRPAR